MTLVAMYVALASHDLTVSSEAMVPSTKNTMLAICSKDRDLTVSYAIIGLPKRRQGRWPPHRPPHW